MVDMNTTTIRRMAAGALVLSLALTGCGSDVEGDAAAATIPYGMTLVPLSTDITAPSFSWVNATGARSR
jgi:hypothetical protein